MEHQFMTFAIGDSLYGLDILAVKEINRCFEVTPVPLSNSHIMGLINLRGQIVTLIDFRVLLGIDTASTPEPTLIILKMNAELSPVARGRHMVTHPDSAGFLVDRIGDVVVGHSSDIRPVPANADRLSVEVLSGILSYQDQLVGCVDLEKLFQKTEGQTA